MASASTVPSDAAMNAALVEAQPHPYAGTAPFEQSSSFDASTDAAPRVSQENVGGQPAVSQEMRVPRVTRLSLARAALIALYDCSSRCSPNRDSSCLKFGWEKPSAKR